MFKRILSFTVIFCFFLTSMGPFPNAHADTLLGLPAPGTMVNLSPAYMPVMMQGLKVHPENPLLFDFIMDTGKSGLNVNSPQFKAEAQKLIKYFLAALTIKEDDLWVNLSPYEKNRMISQDLGKTELGRDMLAQDYILKQLTASLIYPEKQLGKEFWNTVYSKSQQMFGSTEIPVNTFNKVWIVADKAKVLERNNVGYVIGAHLKVMLEEDYLALQKYNTPPPVGGVFNPLPNLPHKGEGTHALSSQIIRQIILPEIEKEVNQGKNFASLRQIFYSMILATWYKQALKDALLNQVYSNKGKTSGVLSNDPRVKEKIYDQYLKAYKKGVFNYIKEDVDAASQQSVGRKYFSGGIDRNFAMQVQRVSTVTREEINQAMSTRFQAVIVTVAVVATIVLSLGRMFQTQGPAQVASAVSRLLPFADPGKHTFSQNMRDVPKPAKVIEETDKDAFKVSLSPGPGAKSSIIYKIDFTNETVTYTPDGTVLQEFKPDSLGWGWNEGMRRCLRFLAWVIDKKSSPGQQETLLTEVENITRLVAKHQNDPQGLEPARGMRERVRVEGDTLFVPLKQAGPEEAVAIDLNTGKAVFLPFQKALGGESEPRSPRGFQAQRAIMESLYDMHPSKDSGLADFIHDVREAIKGRNVRFNFDDNMEKSDNIAFQDMQDGGLAITKLVSEQDDRYRIYPDGRITLRGGDDTLDYTENRKEHHPFIISAVPGEAVWESFLNQVNIYMKLVDPSTVGRHIDLVRNLRNKRQVEIMKTSQGLRLTVSSSFVIMRYDILDTGKGTIMRYDQKSRKVTKTALTGSYSRTVQDYLIADTKASLQNTGKYNKYLSILDKIGSVADKDNQAMSAGKIWKWVALGTMPSSEINHAMAHHGVDKSPFNPGGIDLNARNMGLDVTQEGNNIEMKFNPAMVAEFRKGNFTGVEGIILKITSIDSPLSILDMATTAARG